MMDSNQEQFFNSLKELLEKHSASVAFTGNQLVWYVGDKQFNIPGIVTNSKSVKDILEP